MKNLKRTLCLMLACCLTVGLLAVSASAAFDDQSDIQHLEAATVLNELEVLQGYSDGTFGPDDTLTRAQAAALIARMLLGVDNADSMVTSSAPFSDVATSHWAAGYISYCVSVGIVAGYGDGRFGPEDALTIGAFAKMLVGALGYDSDFEELAGSSWLINTAKLAVSNDLLDDVAASYTASCSRDDAAQMVFNTLQATLVEYSSGGIKVEVGDATVNVAPSAAEKKDANSYDGNIEEDDYLQFAEYYFPDLVLNVDVDAAFGRPSAYNWELDGTVIFESTDDGDLLDSYTTKVSKGTLYNLIGSTAYKELKAGTATLTVWVDGIKEEDDPDYSDYFVKNSSSKADGTGYGVLTEIYMDDDNNVTIVQIHTYLAVATDDYDEDDELLEIEIYDHDELDEYTLYLEDFDIEGLEEDDWLLVTVDDNEVYTVSLAYMVEGEITGYSVDTSITLDGGKYYYSSTFADSTFASDSFSIGSDIVLILDPYGYILGNDDVETDDAYVFIAEVAESGSLSNSGYVAAAYFTDGTYAEIKLKNVDDNTPDTDDFGWFTYTVNSAGKYLLDSVDMDSYVSNDSTALSTRNGYVRFLLNDDDDAANVRATNSTIFVVVDDDGDVDTYTGYKNIPTINASGNGKIDVYVVENSSGYASYVFIDAGDASIKNAVSESSDVLFVYYDSYGVNVDRYNNTYYSYNYSLINGDYAVAYTTFKLDSVGLYIDVTYDDYGYIDDAELVTATIDDEFLYVTVDDASVAYASGVLTIGDVDFALADYCDIFLIDDYSYDTVTATKFAKNYDNLTAAVYGVVDDDEVIAIYVVLE